MSQAREHDSQSAPIPNRRPAVIGEVIEDLRMRSEFGLRKYGALLQPGNGRDALRDAYEEACDLVMYLKQALMERDAS